MFGKVSNLLLLFLFNITKIKKVDFWHKHKQRGFIHMSFLNNLPFRTKIFCSFFCLIILTIILATTSSLSISSARARAIEKIESLNVRYERTRRALDSFYEMNFLSKALVSNEGNTDELISRSASVMEKMQSCADALQMKRFPKEIGAIKESTKTYLTAFRTDFFL